MVSPSNLVLVVVIGIAGALLLVFIIDYIMKNTSENKQDKIVRSLELIFLLLLSGVVGGIIYQETDSGEINDLGQMICSEGGYDFESFNGDSNTIKCKPKTPVTPVQKYDGGYIKVVR